MVSLQNLPSEPQALQQIILQLFDKLQKLKDENKKLKEQLTLLKAKHYGSSSEKKRIDKEIEEVELRIEENESTIKALDPDKLPSVKKNKKLPADLPREEVILNPDPICPDCGSSDFHKIGEDISETLEYVPASFKVIKNIRPRCACNHCEKIVQAYPPSNTIDKGKAGSGLLSHILIQKYCNHLPFYRQSQMFAYEDIDIGRSTLTSWGFQCFKLLEPLVNELSKFTFSTKHLHGDDTPVKVLAPGKGKTKLGRIWAYVKDGRPHGDNSPRAAIYFYSPDRKGIRPANHLKDFKGTFHADAYSGYDKLYTKDIKESACWAHTRRKFYEVALINKNATIANQTLEQIQKIYQVEKEIRGKPPDERLKVRKEKSINLVTKLFAYFKKAQKLLPKKSKTALAIQYALNNQEALERFLNDGKVEIDNNAAERALRPVALGRKNWLFAGSDNGGHMAAAMYTLIESAKLNGINPWKYLQKVLTVIQDHKVNQMEQLLPWNIKLD